MKTNEWQKKAEWPVSRSIYNYALSPFCLDQLDHLQQPVRLENNRAAAANRLRSAPFYLRGSLSGVAREQVAVVDLSAAHRLRWRLKTSETKYRQP